MRKIRLILFVLIAFLFYTMNAQTSLKPRIIVTTDLGFDSDDQQSNATVNGKSSNRLRVMVSSDFPPFPVTNSDPDDVQSMVRFLLHSNEFDVEGIIASAGTFSMVANKNNVLAALDKYDLADENLRTHDVNFPTADYLRSVTYKGLGNEGSISIQWGCDKQSWSSIIGSEKDSEASNAIIAAADKDDSRPIYIGVWGGSREVAQAIWKVQNTRSQAELDAFISKLRVYLIACQDATHSWLMDNFPDLHIIESRSTYQGMFGVDNQEWVYENIINNHGALCAIYPDHAMAGTGVIEGDTPSFLYLLSANRGINNPEDPTQPSWGGQYTRVSGTNHYVDGPGKTTISMWKTDFEAEFKERADWCVSSTIIPVTGVSLDPTTATVNVGSAIQLSASIAPSNATNKSVSWSSSNTSVATVSSTGLVSGISVGTTTITVTTTEGLKTASSVVTIIPAGSGSTIFWLEAECATLGSSFNTVADAKASGGEYITVQSGTNSAASAPGTTGQVAFTINVSEAGSYAVWARVNTPNANDDSFWVQVDGGSWFMWNSIGPNTSWAWEQASAYTLSAGSHEVVVAYREDGALLDKLYITKDGDTPSGIGSVASNCGNTSDFYTLSTSVNGSGTVSGAGTYDEGSVVTLTAQPANSWVVNNWSGVDNSSGNTATVTMNSNKSVSVTFIETTTPTYTLTTNVVGSGTVSGGGIYTTGTLATVTATPESGNIFEAWSGDASGTNTSVSITMDANKTVTATFVPEGVKPCGNPSTISLSFTQNGVGEFCWFTDDAIAYVNSWNLNSLTINGSDFTNTWSDNMPARVDGGYYIAYSGAYSWAHFEASALKSAEPLAKGSHNEILVYPNPFDETVFIDLSGMKNINRLDILNSLGQIILTKSSDELSPDVMSFHLDNAGSLFIIQVYANNQVFTKSILKK